MIQSKLCDRVTADAGAVRLEFSDGTMSERVDPTTPLGRYIGEAGWKYQRSRTHYLVKVRPGFTLHEKLGQVWKKNDGRWNWIRHKSRYQSGWKEGQGVAESETKARLQVEKGWL